MKLPASKFPERADAYVCDRCGRDITRKLHPGHAHVRQPLGPPRYTCQCGEKYLTGAIEWDQLGPWQRQQWIRDVGLAIIVLAVLIVLSVSGYVAVRRHSLLLTCLIVVVVLFSIPVWKLFAAILSIPFEIAASLWRTRIAERSRADEIRLR
jgi:hypothetical protein